MKKRVMVLFLVCFSLLFTACDNVSQAEYDTVKNELDTVKSQYETAVSERDQLQGQVNDLQKQVDELSKEVKIAKAAQTAAQDKDSDTTSKKEKTKETAKSDNKSKSDTKKKKTKSSTSKKKKSKKKKKKKAKSDNSESSTTTKTTSSESSISYDNINVSSNPKDMHLKDIAESKGLYIGLNYVKSMDYLPLALDQKEEVDPSHEVIIPFIEVFNGASKKQTFRADKISCYIDGTQVDKVDTYLRSDIDGIHAIGGSYELEPGTMALLTRDYEVTRGWSEMKLFYDDSCIWTLSSSEVGTDKFNRESLFNIDVSREVTQEGGVIYDDEYKVTYKGFEEYTKDNLWGSQDYAIVKLTIENTGDKMLDFGLVGYNMRGYNNNYLMDSPNYTLDEKFDSFINIHNVENIQIGMSTDAYVAFEITEPVNSFYFVYDTGYIIDNALGSVYYKK